MPTLNEYVPSSSKSGYYIRANVGRGAPVTLQVTNLATRILSDNGFSDGDTVPTKLVWSMYDIDLVYTEGTGPTSSTRRDVAGSFSDHHIDARLDPATREALIEYLSQYSGARRRSVNRLQTRLERAQSRNTARTHDEAAGEGDKAEAQDRTTRQAPIERQSVTEGIDRALRVVQRRLRWGVTTVFSAVSNGRSWIERTIGRPRRRAARELPDAVVDEYDTGSLVLTEPTPEVDPSSEFLVGTVDRVSQNGNPVVELDAGGHLTLDRGEPGERYLIERSGTQKGATVARYVADN